MIDVLVLTKTREVNFLPSHNRLNEKAVNALGRFWVRVDSMREAHSTANQLRDNWGYVESVYAGGNPPRRPRLRAPRRPRRPARR